MNKTKDKTTPWVFNDFIKLIVLNIAYFALTITIARLLPSHLRSAFGDYVFILWDFYVLGLIYFLFFKIYKIRPFVLFRKTSLFLLFAAVFLQLAILLSRVTLANGFGDIAFLLSKSSLIVTDEVRGKLVKLIIGTSFVQAIWEEILFRGVVQFYIEKRLGVVASLIIPSALFSLLHLGPEEVGNLKHALIYVSLLIFLENLIKAYIAYKQRSVTLPLIMHITNNAFASYIYVLYTLL